MARRTKKKRGTERSPVSELSDDLLVEIISRVPYKSTCCCKCVCTRWRDLVSHPDHRKKLPRSTLAGIFYQTYDMNRCPSLYPGYTSVSGNWCSSIDLTLSFLPKCKRRDMQLFDCCNGLLLFRCSKSKQHCGVKTLDYVVCNPISEKWVVVPGTSWSSNAWIVRLGFDPAVSSHFYVFEFAHAGLVDANTGGDDLDIKAVVIYSSKSGAWTHRVVWDSPISIFCNSKSLFYRGMLHLSSDDDFVLVVGVEGKHRVIRVPMPHSAGDVHNVYLSQGQLHLAKKGASGLSIWALEDYSSENWRLKHNVRHLQLRGTHCPFIINNYEVISIHPEYNLIFLVREKSCRLAELMSYDIDSRELRFVSKFTWGCQTPYLPYVPLFSDSLAD